MLHQNGPDSSTAGVGRNSKSRAGGSNSSRQWQKLVQEDWWPTTEEDQAGAKQGHAEQKRDGIRCQISQVANRQSDVGIDSRQGIVKVQAEIGNTRSGR